MGGSPSCLSPPQVSITRQPCRMGHKLFPQVVQHKCRKIVTGMLRLDRRKEGVGFHLRSAEAPFLLHHHSAPFSARCCNCSSCGTRRCLQPVTENNSQQSKALSATGASFSPSSFFHGYMYCSVVFLAPLVLLLPTFFLSPRNRPTLTVSHCAWCTGGAAEG